MDDTPLVPPTRQKAWRRLRRDGRIPERLATLTATANATENDRKSEAEAKLPWAPSSSPDPFKRRKC